MTPDEYEDAMYEMNRELGKREQTEIERRVEYALGPKDPAWRRGQGGAA